MRHGTWDMGQVGTETKLLSVEIGKLQCLKSMLCVCFCCAVRRKIKREIRRRDWNDACHLYGKVAS